MNNIDIEKIIVFMKCNDGKTRQRNKSYKYKKEIEEFIMEKEWVIDLSKQTYPMSID